MRNRLTCLGLFGALVASGCSLEDVDSDAIRTRGMFADMLALAGVGATRVTVQLTVGGENGTNVTLIGEDRLEARFGELSTPMQRSSGGTYQVEFPGNLAGEVVVELTRGPDDDPAGGSAQLPEPFSPALGTDASAGIDRESEVALTWSPTVPGGSMAWEVDGDCLWSESGVTADDGALVLGPESFQVRTSQAGEECEARIRLDRQREGAVDAAWYPNSRFSAAQRRYLDFVSIPAPAEREALEQPDETDDGE